MQNQKFLYILLYKLCCLTNLYDRNLPTSISNQSQCFRLQLHIYSRKRKDTVLSILVQKIKSHIINRR